MSEKSFTRQHAGLVRRAKTSRRNLTDLPGACSGGKFVVSTGGEAYDAQVKGPNRKFQFTYFYTGADTIAPGSIGTLKIKPTEILQRALR